MCRCLDNGVKSVTLSADMAGVRAMLAAERKRGQASIGIGANLATAFQNYSVASYQWNASWFAAFVDQAAAAGVVELSVFPAGMTDLSTAGVDAFFLDSLRRFLAHKTPEASAGARHANQVILPTASGVSNEGRSSPLLVPVPAASWPWVPACGSLEPPRRGGENAQKTGEKRARYGLRSVNKERTGDQLSGSDGRALLCSQ